MTSDGTWADESDWNALGSGPEDEAEAAELLSDLVADPALFRCPHPQPAYPSAAADAGWGAW